MREISAWQSESETPGKAVSASYPYLAGRVAFILPLGALAQRQRHVP